ncbi:prolyl oligopeptidase family serine peptidase [Flavobacterium sp. TP390]|uniref:Prolyl oligopeptidase family serine peptidase n=1 Tax=Flavobacterium profundi TaxID=1774945 RepID=A0A6I4ID92_9FLAO|nr:prolyl oligopeptidase family serine peptidase [Flavobacterium profundi]MVO07623.1 prolyl oligopeptidase family serine peptidase [Flavobacterium profundi]
MKVFFISACLLIAGFSSFSQENVTYQKPPQEILTLADYQRAPSVSMDSKKEYMLLTYRNTYKNLEDLSQEEMRLGGLRINPVTNISSTITYANNLKIGTVKNKSETQVSGLPDNPKIANISWSPNEKYIAFTHTTSQGVTLWYIDVATAKATKLSKVFLNANMGNPISWYKDSKALLVTTLATNPPALINSKEALPKGPIVSESEGKVSQNRTYQDLLKNKADEANFVTLATSKVDKIDLDGNRTSFSKTSGLFSDVSFSPDGNYVMITSIEKPFSYLVPYYRFPQITVVYDINGNEIKTVNEVPLNEISPKGFMSTRTGKRNMAWRSDVPATLYYVEALDGGDQANEVPFRDEVFLWEAPFTNAPQSLLKVQQRFAGIQWGNNTTAILSDYWYDTRNSKTYLINPSVNGAEPKLIWDRNYQDKYSDPGSFESKKNDFGNYVLTIENNKMFLLGDGFTKEGQFPFIDEFDIKTLKTKRIYTSKLTDKKEDLLSIEDSKKGDVLVMLQSKNEYPNYYFRNLKTKKITPITAFKNPFKSLNNVYKEVITYKRNDGVTLSGTLYLPANYDRNKKDQKLPLLIWAYPEEFKDKNSAGQTTQNPNDFTFPYYGSFVYWVTRGYAVLDDASFPIIGEGTTEPNDTFIPQLVANAKAAIDAVDDLGYINRKKVAVGGHSYGAFMTANLLTHSDLFACGIARSGAYNRTLTPFGFQSEQRNYWDVPEVYNMMSPFMNASKMKTPLLLVHGEADNNPGTFTLQTERYFQALKGLGAPVRMVLLPKESHGYVAEENIFHLLWEQDQFLEKYLKN